MTAPVQIGPEREYSLRDLTGKLLAWYADSDQPVMIDFAGMKVVPVFETEETLRAVMKHIGVAHFKLKKIDDGADFALSVKQAGYECAFNVHIGPIVSGAEIAPLRYTLVKFYL